MARRRHAGKIPCLSKTPWSKDHGAGGGRVTAKTRQRAVVTLYGLPSGGMLRYIWGDGSAPEWVPIGADPASGEHVYSRGRGPYVLDVLARRADNSYFGSGMIIVRTGEDPADVQPTITAVVPADGPDVGGSGVIIDGTGLTGSTAATFGGTPATGSSWCRTRAASAPPRPARAPSTSWWPTRPGPPLSPTVLATTPPEGGGPRPPTTFVGGALRRARGSRGGPVAGVLSSFSGCAQCPSAGPGRSGPGSFRRSRPP
jgi:hypothetical protein